MAMINTCTYNLSVTWGKYMFNFAQDSSALNPPEARWGWKAIATVIQPNQASITPPTGWNYTEPLGANILVIECLTYSWADMLNKIALLGTFWEPSNT